jgi:hypothetical protein
MPQLVERACCYFELAELNALSVLESQQLNDLAKRQIGIHLPGSPFAGYKKKFHCTGFTVTLALSPSFFDLFGSKLARTDLLDAF